MPLAGEGEEQTVPEFPPLIDLSIPLPKSRFIPVPHVRQSYAWDCGLACVLMVLRALGFTGVNLKTLRQMCPTMSVWSVDLAHLLRRFGVDVQLLTVTIGANPGFADEKFYKENMADDVDRVNRLFENAGRAGISIQCRSISSDVFRSLVLCGRYIVIALIDKKWFRSLGWTHEFCFPDCFGLSSGYTGHYIVVCGYDHDRDEYEIRDPSSSSEVQRVSTGALEAARRSYGTDEDLLLISYALEEDEESLGRGRSRLETSTTAVR
ncbi:Guanylyl cyclase domain containing protein [Klebsormidium nitens]|uniref:Guanylyl cyclase domain containing protein n=1 Tax=Klebsormidium nitens TaxID=105231 RepID=A0A1Y1INU5_KLENI|nr:Guanylyl cyclase domain containing protein [Klebsormidium nitens]|eukprot:GAQ91159.1 Guanylyl cyclase domain containing protein [Klebsormidium nitens]